MPKKGVAKNYDAKLSFIAIAIFSFSKNCCLWFKNKELVRLIK